MDNEKLILLCIVLIKWYNASLYIIDAVYTVSIIALIITAVHTRGSVLDKNTCTKKTKLLILHLIRLCYKETHTVVYCLLLNCMIHLYTL